MRFLFPFEGKIDFFSVLFTENFTKRSCFFKKDCLQVTNSHLTIVLNRDPILAFLNINVCNFNEAHNQVYVCAESDQDCYKSFVKL